MDVVAGLDGPGERRADDRRSLSIAKIYGSVANARAKMRPARALLHIRAAVTSTTGYGYLTWSRRSSTSGKPVDGLRSGRTSRTAEGAGQPGNRRDGTNASPNDPTFGTVAEVDRRRAPTSRPRCSSRPAARDYWRSGERTDEGLRDGDIECGSTAPVPTDVLTTRQAGEVAANPMIASDARQPYRRNFALPPGSHTLNAVADPGPEADDRSSAKTTKAIVTVEARSAAHGVERP